MRMTAMTEYSNDNQVPPGTVDEPARDTTAAATRLLTPPQRSTALGGETVGNIHSDNPFMVAEDVNVYYGDNHAIQHVSLEIGKKEVIALIGPSGCGKSTFLRCLNPVSYTHLTLPTIILPCRSRWSPCE